MAPILAGACGYYEHRMAYKTQSHRYRSMKSVFNKAKESVCELTKSASTSARSPSVQQTEEILLELGRQALNENQAWVRTHRARPIGPIRG